MDFIIDNLFIIVCSICVGVVLTLAIIKFVKMPTSEQVKTIQAWLLHAVIWAEAAYGSKTGKLKLSQVYSKFCLELPWIAKVITFEKFSGLVDEALVTMRKMLEENRAVSQIVNGVSE